MMRLGILRSLLPKLELVSAARLLPNAVLRTTSCNAHRSLSNIRREHSPRVFLPSSAARARDGAPCGGDTRNYSQQTDEDAAVAAETGAPDLLSQQLERVATATAALDLVTRHADVMNDAHVFAALFAVARLSRRASVAADDPRLQTLCRHVERKARFFAPEELVNAFKYCGQLRLSARSRVVQTLLQLIRRVINDLDVEQLMFVSFLLQRQRETTPVGNALLIAAPLVVAMETRASLGAMSLPRLVDAIEFFARFPDAIPAGIAAAVAVRIGEEGGGVTAAQAMRTLASLSRLRLRDDAAVTAASRAIAAGCGELADAAVAAIARCCSILGCGDARLLDAAAAETARRGGGLASAYPLAQLCAERSHFSRALTDHVARLLAADPSLAADRRYSLLTLADFLSVSDYRAAGTDAVVRHLAGCAAQVETLRARDFWLYVGFAKALVVLGRYDDAILREVFNPDNVDYLLNRYRPEKREVNLRDLHFIDQAVSMECMSYCGPQLSDAYRNEAIALTRETNQDYPLHGALERGFGDAQYVKTNVYTRHGHHIDHLIALNKYNQPMTTTLGARERSDDDVMYVEDLVFPYDCRIVALNVLHEEDYCSNMDKRRGESAVKQRQLLQLGYCPVAVNYQKWLAFPDSEKVPYLVREVKNATITTDMPT